MRCLLLVMCTHPVAKEALTFHLACSEGRKRYFGCNLMHRKVLASSHQHLMAEAPYKRDKNGRVCDLVLPSDPHFSSEMLKSPDFLRRIQKMLLAAGHPVGEFGHPRPTG